MGFILDFLGSNLIKNLIVNGLELLVKRTDTGIDNDLLEIMLDKSVESKRNKLTEDIKNEIIKKIK